MMHSKSRIATFFLWTACLMWALAIIFPILWGLMLSLKTRVDALSMPPNWIFRPTFENYSRGLIEGKHWKTFLNSLIIASGSSALALGFGVPAAYVFSRFRFKGSISIFFALLTTRMAPPLILALPLFLIFTKLRMIDNYLSIILVHAAVSIAVVVWIMKGFFDEVPKDIDDASLLDGDGWWGTFFKQICPLVAPGLLITGFYCFISSWNEFFLAMILTGFESRPFTVAVPALITPHGTYWGQVTAISTIGLFPCIAFALLARKYLVRQLTLGAVRG